MQRGERQTIREGSRVKVSDLREQFRTASKPAKPTKAAKHVKNAPIRNTPDVEQHKPKGRQQHQEQKDKREEQMAKAERLAQIQHTTSLLKTKPKNDRLKSHKEKKKSGLLLQLMLVMLVAAGATVALEPSILPAEVRNLDWLGMKYELDAWLQSVTG